MHKKNGLPKDKILFLLAKSLWDISACGVRFEDVSGVIFGACSASTAYFTVFADSTFAFEVAFVS